MKKTVILILTAALLAACFTGCSTSPEVQFGADCLRFARDAMDLTSDMEDFTTAIADCLKEDGITTQINDEGFFTKCVMHYESLLQEWKLDGWDIAGQSTTEITDRLPGIREQYEALSKNTVDAENGDELIDAVNRLYRAEQAMLNLIVNIYGPGETYHEQALQIWSDASKAHSDIIELTQPYYQKRGFINLANAIKDGG